MLQFKDVVSRADSLWLQNNVGALTTRVLAGFEGKGAGISQLRRAFLLLCHPLDFLANPQQRENLFELLRPSEAAALVSMLDIEFDNDPYAALRGLKISRRSIKFEILCAFFGTNPDKEMPAPELPDTVTAIEPKYGLFLHQREAVDRASFYLKKKSRRVLLHMPTGAGKTRMAMHIVCQHITSNPSSVVVWLANSEELCEQAVEEFEQAWSCLGNRSVAVTRFWGNHSTDLNDVPEGLFIGGFSKLYSSAKSCIADVAFLGDKTSLIVVDEAHRVIAPTYEVVIEGLAARSEHMAVLGLTATPGRTWNDPEADRLLANFFNKQKVTLEVRGFETPVDFLIQEGYLASPIFRQLPHVSESLTSQELRNLALDLDIPPTILKKFASDERRSVLIIRAIEELLARHTRVIVFSTTVAHAKMLAAVLSARGNSARFITGETTQVKRSEAIEWFKSPVDESRVLINFGVLTAGFDAPKTSAVLIARPTKSLVLYSQMVGRATRGIRAGGNAVAEIVTVVDTALPGFGDLSKAFTNWEDVW